MQRVLFVCLGNICRSPTAQGVFETLLAAHPLAGQVEVDSCGTAAWHIGKAPDERSVAEAQRRGYRLDHLRARQVQARDFQDFDYILAMDEENLAELQALCPADFAGHLGLFLDFAPASGLRAVPDPYYGGAQGFSDVLDLVEQASEGLLRALEDAHQN